MPPMNRIPHSVEKVQRILEKVLLNMKLVEKVSLIRIRLEARKRPGIVPGWLLA
jgi:hypothetical protein